MIPVWRGTNWRTATAGSNMFYIAGSPGFAPLPDKYFRNPKLHYEEHKSNYELAATRAPNLVSTLKNVRGFWSPFAYLN